MPFSISAAAGMIALSGIAVLNGLVMISYIRQLRIRGLHLEVAIRARALTSLRPVLMTALGAALWFVPMVLSTSVGRKHVLQGKRLSVSVDRGGRRYLYNT